MSGNPWSRNSSRHSPLIVHQKIVGAGPRPQGAGVAVGRHHAGHIFVGDIGALRLFLAALHHFFHLPLPDLQAHIVALLHLILRLQNVRQSLSLLRRKPFRKSKQDRLRKAHRHQTLPLLGHAVIPGVEHLAVHGVAHGGQPPFQRLKSLPLSVGEEIFPIFQEKCLRPLHLQNTLHRLEQPVLPQDGGEGIGKIRQKNIKIRQSFKIRRPDISPGRISKIFLISPPGSGIRLAAENAGASRPLESQAHAADPGKNIRKCKGSAIHMFSPVCFLVCQFPQLLKV